MIALFPSPPQIQSIFLPLWPAILQENALKMPKMHTGKYFVIKLSEMVSPNVESPDGVFQYCLSFSEILPTLPFMGTRSTEDVTYVRARMNEKTTAAEPNLQRERTDHLHMN